MVHIIYDVNMPGHYYQVGSGESPFYEGFRFQRGFGYRRRQGGRGMFGSLMSKAWRYLVPLAQKYAVPLVKEAGRAFADEGLSAGQKVLHSIQKGTDVGDALVTESTEMFKNLANRGVKRLVGQPNIRPRSQLGGGKKPRKKPVRSIAHLHAVGRSVQESAVKNRRRTQTLGTY